MAHLLTLHNPATARENYLSGVWQTDTLYSLARRHATDRGGAYALRDSSRRLTWSTVVAWADAVAADLQSAGLRDGDRVAVWLPSRLENVIIFLACSRNGYVCNASLHQNYTVAEIKALLARIDSKAIFAQPDWGADAATANIFAEAAQMPQMKRAYALAPLRTPHAPLPAGAHAIPQAAQGSNYPFSAPSANADQVVYLAFTSGTTGTPKGVMHSDNTLLANARAMVADWGHDTNTVLLTLSPMSHHIGTVALNQVLVAGGELVEFDPTAGVAALDWVEQTGATYVMGVPTHAIDLLQEVDKRGLKSMGAVKTFYMAGAPIPTEVARRLLELGAKPQNVYGMTENGSHQYTKPNNPVSVITSTCGKSLSGYEIRLWSQENHDVEVGPGEVGEIGGRGGVLMLGYFNNQSATENSFNSSGWFLSGDLGQFDGLGNLRIVGRAKDLIIRGGHNIHPAHIEEYAHRHPKVKKAAAFGVPDERLGEKVCLALICHSVSVDAQEILLHLAKEGLSRFDMPEYFSVVNEFPLTASGKILKRELLQWVVSGRLQPQPVRYSSLANA